MYFVIYKDFDDSFKVIDTPFASKLDAQTKAACIWGMDPVIVSEESENRCACCGGRCPDANYCEMDPTEDA